MGKSSSAIALAATKSQATAPLTRIMNGRARVMVEQSLNGMEIPKKGKERAIFLEGVAGISEKVLGERTARLVYQIKRRYWGRQLNHEIELLKLELAHLRGILDVCSRSGNQAAYSMFLGRTGFDIESFLNSIGLFADGREVEFTPLPDDKALARENLVREIRKIRRKPESALRGIIDLLKENLSAVGEKPAEPYEIAAILTGRIEKARELLSQEEPSAYLELTKQKEQGDADGAGVLFSIADIGAAKRWEVLRSLADIGFYADPEKAGLTPFSHSFRSQGIEGFIAADRKAFLRKGVEGWAYDNELIVASKASVQHELQHVFDNIALLDHEKGNEVDWEFRAYLAELVFSQERKRLCASWKRLATMKEGSAGLEAHEAAQVLLGSRLKEARARGDKGIIEAAMRILDEAYRSLIGLSYEEIIMPFRKI